MNITVKFLGAASEVTGSKYLLKIDDFKILIDCGLFQGRKQLRELNWDEFPIYPFEIDAVILTHAHLDHTGYLPRLFRTGYRGPVYCTSATADLMHLILMDSARLQVEEFNYAKKKGYDQDENHEPFYTVDDATVIFEDVETCKFEETVTIAPNITARFYNAGHVLGASIVELTLVGNTQTKTIVFSGDIGRYNDPILFPPHVIEHADILFVESTYGNRTLNPTDRDEVLAVMNAAFEKHGNVIIPAFSIGRTQNLLMRVRNLFMSKEIPIVKVIVDSPMAISVTGFYRKHRDFHKLRDIDLDEDESFITLRKQLINTRTTEESKKINEIAHDCIIIASSGMMTGGRILHHLYRRLSNPDNTLLILGYQAHGSLGRKLQEGAETVTIFGEEVPVKAKIFTVSGLSAHADRNELLTWLSGFKKPPQQTFAIHGEVENAQALADALSEKGWNTKVPHYLEDAELFNNI